MKFKALTSAENEKIKLYRKLCSDKKARRSLELFPLEGARLIRDAAAEKGELTLVFVTEKFGEEPEKLAKIYGSENIYIITEELAAKMSDTSTPQGIFAVCKTPSVHGNFTEIIPGGRYIILDNLQDPGNMGTILRTADSLGIDGIACCNCCDLFSPKTVRSAMGSLLRVRTMCGEFEKITEMFRKADIPIFSAVTDDDAQDIKKCDFSRGGAVIIGNEGSGIPKEHITGKRITIRMHGTVDSLNAAMAAGIMMWVLEAGN